MPKPRLTIHQRELRREKDAIADALTPIVYEEYQRVMRAMVTRLRRIDRTRPKLRKAGYTTSGLWERFRERMRVRIMQGIKSGVISLESLVVAFLAKQPGIPPVEINTTDFARAFEDQLGLRIVGIENSLRREVGRKVVAWYNTPGSKLGDIIDDLTNEETGLFTRSRAERVARTEVTRLNSMVQERVAEQVGAKEWWWGTRNDASVCKRDKRWMKGPDGQMYTGCRELHGRRFLIGQPMPPDSSHPHCRCDAILIMPEVPPVPVPLEAPA